MIGERRVLGLVAARGGSKGLPGKNVALLGGQPLVAWTVAAAKASRHVDRIIVSTDDPTIRDLAVDAGADAPFVRPAHLATDTARMDEVVIHALDTLGDAFEVCVLLQATSPLRTAADIDGALDLLERSGAPSVVSVVEAAKPPYWMFRVDDDHRTMDPLFPELSGAAQRQALPTAYSLNGAVYAFDVREFRRSPRFVTSATRAYIMPAERSVDVDGALDLAFAEVLHRLSPGR